MHQIVHKVEAGIMCMIQPEMSSVLDNVSFLSEDKIALDFHTVIFQFKIEF